MGAFIVNINVRTDDADAVVTKLKRRKTGRAWVTPSVNGWVTVCDEDASNQDDRAISKLARELSKSLAVPAIAFMIHDSDFCCYWLYDRGKRIDDFNSCPGYFDDGEGDPTGDPEALLPYCQPGTALEAVRAAMTQERTFAEEQLGDLAGFLGIDPDRVHYDFRDFGPDGEADVEATFVGDDGAKSDGKATIKMPTRGPRAKSIGIGQLEQLISSLTATAPVDPIVRELVAAAAVGDVPAIERLVAGGAAIDGEAPMPAATGVDPRLNAGFAVTPLLAAITSRHVDAARRLIELGANVHRQHPMFGQPFDIALRVCSPKLLTVLLDAGVDATSRNRMGITALATLAHVRASTEQIRKLIALHESQQQTAPAHFAKLLVADDAIAACEQLLSERGAT